VPLAGVSGLVPLVGVDEKRLAEVLRRLPQTRAPLSTSVHRALIRIFPGTSSRGCATDKVNQSTRLTCSGHTLAEQEFSPPLARRAATWPSRSPACLALGRSRSVICSHVLNE
jgi:hypothetical protein